MRGDRQLRRWEARITTSLAALALSVLLALCATSPASARVSFTRAWGWGVRDGASRFETCTITCQPGLEGLGAGELDEPYGVAVDGSGDVFVTDRNNRLDEFRTASSPQNTPTVLKESQSTWSKIARRAAFPVYRPLDTLGLRFNGAGLARGAPGIPSADTGCLSASWGDLHSGRHARLAIDEPGDSIRCGQPGEATHVATVVVNGVKVQVLVQCAAFPKCTIKDGETDGEFLLFVPERAAKRYAIQLDSAHVSLSDFVKVARSFTKVKTTQSDVARQALQTTWINTSGCAIPSGGNDNGLVWAQHPATIGLTCDPHDTIVGARWRNWGDLTARATATLAVDDCNPNCATGRVRRYAITLAASNIRRCGARRVYANVTYSQRIAGHKRSYPVPAEGFC
jgi:hypothetical protein